MDYRPCHNCGEYPKDCDCPTRDDFALRCQMLESHIRICLTGESSKKVRASVFCKLMKDLMDQENSDK